MSQQPEKKATLTPEERKKLLGDIVHSINKNFGEGAIMMLGAMTYAGTDVLPTGSIMLDEVIGPHGIPKGKVVEIFGPEGSGKTTLTLSIAAQAQQAGGLVAIVDAEHALDPDYASRIGVNVGELLVNQPEYGEQGLEIASQLIQSGAISLVIVDSVAALTPKAELEGDMEDANMALQARMMGKAMRKIKTLASIHRCTVIFINQLREKPGVSFGNPTYSPGGKALKFFSDIRLEIYAGEAIKNGEEIIGRKPTAKAVKNKVAPPFRKATFTLIFGQGIDNVADLLKLAVDRDLIEKAGSWYSHGGKRIGQGEEQAKKWLKENVAVMDQIEAAIKDDKAKPAEPPAPAADKK